MKKVVKIRNKPVYNEPMGEQEMMNIISGVDLINALSSYDTFIIHHKELLCEYIRRYTKLSVTIKPVSKDGTFSNMNVTNLPEMSLYRLHPVIIANLIFDTQYKEVSEIPQFALSAIDHFITVADKASCIVMEKIVRRFPELNAIIYVTSMTTPINNEVIEHKELMLKTIIHSIMTDEEMAENVINIIF